MAACFHAGRRRCLLPLLHAPNAIRQRLLPDAAAYVARALADAYFHAPRADRRRAFKYCFAASRVAPTLCQMLMLLCARRYSVATMMRHEFHTLLLPG